MQRSRYGRAVVLGMFAVLLLLPLLPGTAAAGPEARKAFPTAEELAKLGLLKGWKRPWELKGFTEGSVRYEAFPSEAAYYAENELDRTVQQKTEALAQIQAIPPEAMAGIKESFAEQEEAGLTSFPAFLAPDERVRTGMFELLRKNAFTKAALVDLFKKHVEPLRDASEISFVTFSRPPGAKDGDEAGVRAARIKLRVFLYDPAHLEKNPSYFVLAPEQVAKMEKQARDFFKNVRELLNERMGENLEEDLEELLARPAKNLTAADRKRIDDLSDGLDALDTLDRYPYKVQTAMPEIGDQCVELRAVYTFPESKRAILAKASADVGTMINTYVRQGSAIAHLSLTTNDNSIVSTKEWNALVHLVSEKLRAYGVQ